MDQPIQSQALLNPEIASQKVDLEKYQPLIAIACLTFFPLLYVVGTAIKAWLG